MKTLKEKKIKVIEKKFFFFDIWYVGRKKKIEELVKLQFNNFKYIILFLN